MEGKEKGKGREMEGKEKGKGREREGKGKRTGREREGKGKRRGRGREGEGKGREGEGHFVNFCSFGSFRIGFKIPKQTETNRKR